jgi:hypothetical protein
VPVAKKKMGDVVVLLPGILGSVLQRDGKDVWSIGVGTALRGVLSLGKSITSLEVKGVDDPTRPDLGDGVTAPRLMPDLHLIPGFWKIDGYGKIKQTMFEQFDLVDGQNWFDFPYDWRRDNRAAALRLAADAPRWLADWRATSGNADAKLVIMAHSMGGLVARHYLEVLDGWRDTRRLITFGTPYQGSVNAIEFLANGFKKGFGPFGLDLSGLLRSLSSVYQLAPRYACVDMGDGHWVHMADATLPNVDPARAKAALQFHRDIEAAVDRHLDDDEYQRSRYAIHPVVGIFQPTRQSVTLKGKVVVSSEEPLDADAPEGGDSTVPRLSATPLEVDDDPREMYAADRHASLQNSDAVLAHVTGSLTRKRIGRFRDAPTDGFTLRLDDLYLPGEPIAVAAETMGPAWQVVVSVEDVDTGKVVRRRTLKRNRADAFAVELAPLPDGVYRLTLQAADADLAMKPVSDLFVVAGKQSTKTIEQRRH